MITAAELQAIVTADTSQAQTSLADFNNSLDLLGKGNALSSLSDAFTNIGETMMGISLIGDGMFAGSIVAAADYEKNLAILGAIEDSTIARNKDMQVVQAGYVNVTNMSTEAIKGLTKERDSEQASLDKLTRQYENGSNRTKSAAERINELKIDIADLNGKLNEGEATHKVWTNGMTVGTAVTHMSREAIDEFANSIERTTRYSKEQTIAAIMMGETFTNIAATQMPAAVEAAMNLSTVFGRDLRTSVIMVDKALQEPIRGVDNLRRIGVQFSDAQKTQIQNFMNQNKLAEAQAIIMHELTIELGGAAVAAGDTMAGKMDQLGNAFKRVFQEMGSNMLPSLEDFIGGIGNLVRQMEPVIKAVLQFIMGASLLGTVIGAIMIVMGLLLTPLGLIVTAVGAVGIAFNNTFGGLANFLSGVLTDIQIFANNVGDALKPVLDALKFEPTQTTHKETIHTQTMNEETGKMQKVTMKVDVPDDPMAKYVENLKNAFTTAVTNIYNAGLKFVDNVRSDFETKLLPKLDDAFKALFGVDVKTAIKPITDAWDNIIYPFFKDLVKNLGDTIENLKKVDWGALAPILLPIGAVILLFSSTLKLAGIGILVDGLKMFSSGLVTLGDAVKLMRDGDIWGGLRKLGDAIAPLAGGLMLAAIGIALMNGTINAGFLATIVKITASAIVTGVAALGTALGTLGTGLWLAIGPMGVMVLVAGAIIAAFIWLIAHKDELTGALNKMAGVIQGALASAFIWVRDQVVRFMRVLAELFRAIPGLSGIATQLDTAIKLANSFQTDVPAYSYNNIQEMYAHFSVKDPNAPVGAGFGTPPPANGPGTPGYFSGSKGRGGGRSNTSNVPPQININTVNVQNPRNPPELYQQVIEEAQRVHAPIQTRTSYA